MKNYASIVVIIVAVLIAVPFLYFGVIHPWAPWRITSSKLEAIRIMHAANKYHLEHNTYPHSIEDLQPKYIDDIQPPQAGNRKWEYSHSDTSCQLMFTNSDYYPSYTVNQSMQWDWQTPF